MRTEYVPTIVACLHSIADDERLPVESDALFIRLAADTLLRLLEERDDARFHAETLAERLAWHKPDASFKFWNSRSWK